MNRQQCLLLSLVVSSLIFIISIRYVWWPNMLGYISKQANYPPPVILDGDYKQYPEDPSYDSQCHCRRVINRPYTDNQNSDDNGEESLCSDSATVRGPGQKVVSFTVYKAVTPYFRGIVKNLQGIRDHYPDYVMRLYHNFDAVNNPEDFQLLCDVFCQNNDLDLCSAHEAGSLGNISDSFGPIWRFSAMADPLVEEFHSRDLDSTIMGREADAVNDWKFNSQATYHAMRDHPAHSTPILAGMFGMRRPKENSKEHLTLMRETLDTMLEESKYQWKNKGLDQDLLRKHLWPLYTNGSGLVHDSYLCNKFKEGSVEVRAFPTKREINGPRNYVGSNGDCITIKDGECPPGCRPEEHKNWRLC